MPGRVLLGLDAVAAYCFVVSMVLFARGRPVVLVLLLLVLLFMIVLLHRLHIL